MSEYILYVDASTYKGNYESIACLYDPQKDFFHEEYIGLEYSHKAECQAIILGIRYLKDNSISKARILTDYIGIVLYLNGDLQSLNKKNKSMFIFIKNILPKHYKIEWIPRKRQLAHKKIKINKEKKENNKNESNINSKI